MSDVRTNQAILKMLEEKQGGLAKEEPLKLIELKIGAGRTQQASRREPWASYEGELEPKQHRAYTEIRIGHMFYTNGLNAKTSNYGQVFGGRTYEEILDQYSDTIKRYNEWRKDLSTRMHMVLDACVSVIGQGRTFADAARNSHGLMSDKTVKRYCDIGIEEYILINKIS